MKCSKQWYTLHQYIVLRGLKIRKNTTYRALLDELIEMPRIRKAIELEELPSPSTLCKAFNWLDMAVWRVLLNLSVTLLPTNGVVGIDAAVRPQSRLKALHEANDVDDLAIESHASGRHKVERDSRLTRDDDTKTRPESCTVAHQAEYRLRSDSSR